MSILPPFTMISVPATALGSRVVRRKRETLATLGSASPRNPSVAIAARSADERNSPASDQDLDLARTGVDAVFDEFFHHGSRTLHHFAGRNLAGDDVWQQANAAHLIADFRFRIADCEQL